MTLDACSCRGPALEQRCDRRQGGCGHPLWDRRAQGVQARRGSAPEQRLAVTCPSREQRSWAGPVSPAQGRDYHPPRGFSSPGPQPRLSFSSNLCWENHGARGPSEADSPPCLPAEGPWPTTHPRTRRRELRQMQPSKGLHHSGQCSDTQEVHFIAKKTKPQPCCFQGQTQVFLSVLPQQARAVARSCRQSRSSRNKGIEMDG